MRRFASVTGGDDDSLEFGLTNVEASFGDGASNFVTLVEKERCYRCLMEWRFRLQDCGECSEESNWNDEAED